MDNEETILLGTLEGGRNNALNAAAFNLAQLSPQYLGEVRLRSWLAELGRRIGLEPAEIGKTINSGVADGMAQPRLISLREPQVEEISPEAPGASSAHERAVAKELGRLRAQRAARALLASESRPPRQPLRIATAGEVMLAPPEPAARVDGLIGWAASVLITAQRKTGKTTFELNLARALLLGEPFLGRYPVRKIDGRVAILNYEVSAQQLARWAIEAGVPPERILTVNLRGGSNPLAWEEERAELAAELRRREVETIMVDPFGRAFTGSDQNSAGDVQAFLLMLDQFCRAEVGALDLMMSAHAGWQQERTRGSSALEDWPDTIITLTKDEDGQRYLRAIGRDVDIEEDQLSYREADRRLLLTGAGSKAQAQASARDADLESEILTVLGQGDGLGMNELWRVLSEQGVKCRRGDHSRAAQRLINKGLAYEEIGPRRARILHRSGA